MKTTAGISHIHYHLPEKIVTNADLVAEFPFLTEEEILKKTGVKKRHITSDGVTGSDLAFTAAQQLLTTYDRSNIDFILFCCEGLDYKAPATACILQHRLALSKNCGAMDIPMGCTGFLNGLSVAKGLIETEQAKNILFLTAEMASTVIHPKDHELRMLFGDAGAATVITADEGAMKIGHFVHGSDGSGANNLIVRRSGTRVPADIDWYSSHQDANGMKLGLMEMNGIEIFTFALKTVPGLIKEILRKSSLTLDDIDHFIFHQPNTFLLETLRRKINIPEEKFIICMEDFGNTVSCSIPIALQETLKNKVLKKGDRILLCAFGIGYSWNATILTC